MAELMPEGQYQGNVTKAEWGSTSNGNPQIVVVFTLAEGVSKTVYIIVNDKTMGYDDTGKPRISQQALNTLGWNGDDPPTFQNTENVPLWMKHDEWQGKVRERWQVSGGSFTGAKPAQDVISRVQSQWRATNGAAPVPTKTPPPNRPTVPQRGAAPTKSPAALGDYSKYTTSQAVFDLWTKNREKAKKPTSSEEWWEFVDSLNMGKKDTEFTPADWMKAAEMADLPF